MPGIPLLVVWVALLCGYIPYSMGFAFLNPVVVIAYGFLSLLIGATVTRPGSISGGLIPPITPLLSRERQL